MPLIKKEKAGTRESKKVLRVAYDDLRMRAGDGIVRAVANGMRPICYRAGICVSEDSRQRCVVHNIESRRAAAVDFATRHGALLAALQAREFSQRPMVTELNGLGLHAP